MDLHTRVIEGPILWRILAVALLLASIFYLARSLIGHDAGWLLYAASRMAEGAELYRDVVDPNPPAIFLLNLAPAWAARLTGLAPTAVFKAYVILLVLLSLALCNRVLRRSLDSTLGHLRASLLVGLLVLLLPGAQTHFGQREHLMLVLVLPYLFSAASWAMGQHEGLRFSLLVGALAGAAVSLKPYFLLIWFLIEGYLMLARGVRSAWMRRENWIIALAQLATGAYVLLAAPEYYHNVIPMARLAYPLSNVAPGYLLDNDAARLWLAALLAFFIIPPKSSLRELRRIAALAATAFLACAVIQQKGFDYHYYPSWAGAFVLAMVVGLDLTLWIERAQRWVWLVFLAGTAGVAFLLTQVEQRPHHEDPIRSLIEVAGRHARGEPILLLSYGDHPAFPTVNYAAARWPYRFSSLWMLQAFYVGAHPTPHGFPYHRPDQMQPLEKYVFDGLVADLLRTPPRLLMIHCATANFDIMEYLAQDPRVRALWRNYEELTTVQCIRILKRTGGASS